MAGRHRFGCANRQGLLLDNMLETIEKLRAQALAEIAGATSLRDAEDLRVKYLGRKGELTGLLRSVS